ncbi:MAG TPA: hypothetical protein DD640_01250 [Clostridiales bacterium]|nr:hypothetical protein [Clostridiales bacterium]
MKIYIVTDLEGISGVDSIDMIKVDHPRHRFAIERLMADTNAAIDGAFLGGASMVTVNDGHGGGNNFDLSLLDPRAVFDTRENKNSHLDDSYAGTFFIGTHAMAGTINAFLDHTQSSASWFNYWVNGRRCGEMAQWAISSAYYDVPVLMVSGDETACAEARSFFNPVACAAVKYANGRNHALCYDLKESEDSIREAARSGMALIGQVKPFKPLLPMEIKLELYRSDYCDELASLPDVERLDARTIRKVVNSYQDVLFG